MKQEQVKIKLDKLGSRPVFVIENVVVCYIEEVREGLSKKTGNPWRVCNVNVKLPMGEDSASQLMRLTFGNDTVDKMIKAELKPQDVITIYVQFDVDGYKFPQNKVNVINFETPNF